jgi:hypothetical protein
MWHSQVPGDLDAAFHISRCSFLFHFFFAILPMQQWGKESIPPVCLACHVCFSNVSWDIQGASKVYSLADKQRECHFWRDQRSTRNTFVSRCNISISSRWISAQASLSSRIVLWRRRLTFQEFKVSCAEISSFVQQELNFPPVHFVYLSYFCSQPSWAGHASH